MTGTIMLNMIHFQLRWPNTFEIPASPTHKCQNASLLTLVLASPSPLDDAR
eukprot:COSAG02_NODE_58672_length_276_cov_1.169492_1_plen_50_part_01